MKDVEGVEDVEGFEARNINIVNILNDLNILWYTPSAMHKPVIFVDWHRTLSNTLFWHSFDAGSAKEQYLRDRINNEVFHSSPEFMQEWDHGRMTSEEFVGAVAELLGEPYELMWFRFVEDCKTFAYDSLHYIDLLSQLRRDGAHVVLATDQGEAFNRFVRPALHIDDHFDDHLVSAALGVTKRDTPKFFATYQEPIANGRALVIDDSRPTCDEFVQMGSHALCVEGRYSTEEALLEARRWLSVRSYAS